MRLLLGLLFSACLARSAHAASFDCNKASTPQEEAVCADPELSRLDENTAAAYRALRRQLSPSAAALVQQDQRAWLLWLQQTCPDQPDANHNGHGRGIGECLTNDYAEQLKTLGSGLQRVGGMTFFPRVKVLTAPDGNPPAAGTFDPGFGVGRYTWPEIDQPTSKQEAWNKAILAHVVRMASSGPPAPREQFDASSVADSSVAIFYTLVAANDRLISVALQNETYNYGAAHPNESTDVVSWWLDAGRPLQAEDVFAPGSGWQAALGNLCARKLLVGEQAKSLDDAKAVRAAAPDSARNPTSWTLDPHQLEVTFGEYSVAPRAAGIISADLRWEELKPYLNKRFDPAGLPAILKRPEL